MENILHHDLLQYVELMGYTGIFLIIFLETGFFLGFFLPGDSLLFTSGLLASQQFFNIWILVPGMILCGIIGYGVAYWTGKKLEPWLLKQKDSIWFKKRYLTEAHAFYERHGGLALVLGRFIPVARTFLPIAAGIAEMDYRKFVFFNVIGGILWILSVTLLGYFLGNIIPDAERYIVPIILLIILASITPAAWKFIKKRA